MKRMVSLLLAFFLLVSLCACSSGKKDENTLTLYITEEEFYWQRAAEDFKQANKGVEVSIVSFKTGEELATKLASDLAAGEGPDVVLWSWDAVSAFDMRRFADNGYFLPLDEYFANDETYLPELYHQPVLDCGKIGGVQYTVPVGFSLMLMCATEEKFSEVGFDQKESVTVHDFLSTVESEAALYEGKDDESAYFYMDGVWYHQGFLFLSGLLEMDFEKKTVSLDREKAAEYARLYKTLYEQEARKEKIYAGLKSWGQCAETISFFASDLDPAATYANFHMTFHDYGHALEFFGVSSDDGDGYTVHSALETAINKNSQNPELAYRFIRSIMDGAPLQIRPDDQHQHGIGCYPSVNKSQTSLYLTTTFVENTGVKSLYTQNFYPDYQYALDHVTNCVYYGLDVHKILRDFENQIVNGDDFDTAYDQLINGLTLYMTE